MFQGPVLEVSCQYYTPSCVVRFGMPPYNQGDKTNVPPTQAKTSHSRPTTTLYVGKVGRVHPFPEFFLFSPYASKLRLGTRRLPPDGRAPNKPVHVIGGPGVASGSAFTRTNHSHDESRYGRETVKPSTMQVQSRCLTGM